VPHVEFTRELARRFNHLYRPVFPEPEALLSEVPKIAGLDGRKMSKSYNNAVFLSEPIADVEAKLGKMMTDPRRARRTDPGDPQDCPAYQSLHKIYCTPEELAYVDKGCKSASIGCLECKKIMIRHVVEDLKPIQERRREIDARPSLVADVLDDGNRRAHAVAGETMRDVRAAIGID
jgi:tryptophanyl-tRNA synthetase